MGVVARLGLKPWAGRARSSSPRLAGLSTARVGNFGRRQQRVPLSAASAGFYE